MIAQSKPRHRHGFSFFPFTSPNPKSNTPSTTTTSSTNTGGTVSRRCHTERIQIQESDCGTNLTSETMSGFDTTGSSTFDIRTTSEQQPFADFDSDHINDESWVTFGINRNDTQNANELSPTSMKVQIGRADMYDATDIHKVGEYNDETVTSTTDHDDDIDFGPLPIVRVPVDGELSQTSEEVVAATSVESTTAEEISHILMLITNMGMNRTQVQNQQRATMMLNSKKITYETIDGSDPSNKDVRNELFAISGTRGTYPQFFVVTVDGDEPQISFLGDFETIEGINDSSSLPTELLDANPTLLTWGRIPHLSYHK